MIIPKKKNSYIIQYLYLKHDRTIKQSNDGPEDFLDLEKTFDCIHLTLY